MQVRQDMLRRSQEMQHETLNTILADYGSGPVSRVTAAYHPSPMRRIELDLPPPAAAVRQSVQMQKAAAAAGGSKPTYGFPAAEKEQSAVDLLENLLQQGKQPASSYQTADAASADANNAWSSSVPVNEGGNVRGSMLVSESTFIFPTGIPAEAGPAAAGDTAEPGHAANDNLDAVAVIPSSSSALDVGNHWGLWQQQQPRLQRHTTSAPGSSYVAADREGERVA